MGTYSYNKQWRPQSALAQANGAFRTTPADRNQKKKCAGTSVGSKVPPLMCWKCFPSSHKGCAPAVSQQQSEDHI